MSSVELQKALQTHLDKAVASGIAPALQCMVVDKEKVLHNVISGLAYLPSNDNPFEKPLTNDSTLWLGSCTKTLLSIVTLSVLEKGQTKNGMGIEHLDDHEKLIEILPEFSYSSGSLFTKILEGFEDGHDAEGRKIMKLRDAKTRITLRMLLTHTSGISYNWINPLIGELYFPTDGSVPHKQPPVQSGKTSDYIAPLICEPNTEYNYSAAPDLVGEFLVRTTGKSLRALYEEHITGPLGIPKEDLDIFKSPQIESNMTGVYYYDGSQLVKVDPFIYSTEDLPPPGHTVFASGALWAKLPAFTKVIQAILREDARLLSKGVWDIATRDDLGPRGLKVPSPELPQAKPEVSATYVDYIETVPEHQVGANLLQAKVGLSSGVTGSSPGSFGWGTVTNTHWLVDPTKGIAIVMGAHVLPYMHPALVQVRDGMEKLVYSHLNTQ